MGITEFQYADKRVLVLGGATGMGAAAAQLTAELGAEITALDIAPITYSVAQAVPVDLRELASVDAALGALRGRFDALFSCAGVADGAEGLMTINFISQRYFLERAVAMGLLSPGSAVVMISSIGGLSWQRNLTQVMAFLAIPTWEAALKWIADHAGKGSYVFSKQAMCGYVAQQAFPLLRQGIRINSVMPGPVDTALARANADIWLAFGKDYRKAAGIQALTAEQVAGVMAFLGSTAANGVTGTNLWVDQGYAGAGMTDTFPAPAIKMMLGMPVQQPS